MAAYGDDVTVFAATCCERGSPCESLDRDPTAERPNRAVTTGRAIGPQTSASWASWPLGAVLWATARRRRARRAPARH